MFICCKRWSVGGGGVKFHRLSQTTHFSFHLVLSCCNVNVCLEVLPSSSAKHLLSVLSCRSWTWTQMKPLAAMLASIPLSPLSLSLSLFVSHFNAELIQSGWAVQEQPSGSALFLHARQEVARTAACNSTWDFVWVTYIMAPFTFYCNFNCIFSFYPHFLALPDFQCWESTITQIQYLSTFWGTFTSYFNWMQPYP